MTKDEIQRILDEHGKWLRHEDGGKLANLSGANLSEANLSGADLSWANLSEANLLGANLSRANLLGANLSEANLSEANLSWADLSEANLSEANLSGANLSGANLLGANLSEANLSGADLSWANLWFANFTCATLLETCLDPNAKPNGDVNGFERVSKYVVGYRSRKAGHIDQYRDGRHYSADVFSTASKDCHPGLYLWPTRVAACQWLANTNRSDEEIIEVRTRPEYVHKAGDKFRCLEFEVIGPAT